MTSDNTPTRVVVGGRSQPSLLRTPGAKHTFPLELRWAQVSPVATAAR
jgi:hypothetical protein